MRAQSSGIPTFNRVIACVACLAEAGELNRSSTKRNPPGVDQSYFAAGCSHVLNQVGRNYNRSVFAKSAQQSAEVDALLRVESGCGFIKKQQSRSIHDSLGNSDTLLHSPG